MAVKHLSDDFEGQNSAFHSQFSWTLCNLSEILLLKQKAFYKIFLLLLSDS